jgi:hypothetical protein
LVEVGREALASQFTERSEDGTVRVESLAIALDGYGAGPHQDIDHRF